MALAPHSTTPRGHHQHRDVCTRGEFRKETRAAYSQASSWCLFLCLRRVSEGFSVSVQDKKMYSAFISEWRAPFVILACSPRSSILIVDPTAEEESLSTAQLTVVTDEEGRLCAVHKPGWKHMLEWSAAPCVAYTTLPSTRFNFYN